MEKLDVCNLMSYVQGGTEIGSRMTNVETEIKDDVVFFKGEIKQSKKLGYNNDNYGEVSGRVKYMDKKSSTIVAIDIDYSGYRNGKEYKYGELVSFEQLNGKKENIIAKVSMNKESKEIKETYFQNQGNGINLKKNYVDTCYNPIQFYTGKEKVKTLSR